MATVQGKHYDQNLDKKTVYDLTENGDWRYGTKTRVIGGPIDHVNKNKNVNKKNPQKTLQAAPGARYGVRGQKELDQREQFKGDSFVNRNDY